MSEYQKQTQEIAHIQTIEEKNMFSNTTFILLYYIKYVLLEHDENNHKTNDSGSFKIKSDTLFV